MSLTLETFPEYLKDSKYYKNNMKRLIDKSEEQRNYLLNAPIHLFMYRDFDLFNGNVDDFIDLFSVLLQIKYEKQNVFTGTEQYIPDIVAYTLVLRKIDFEMLYNRVLKRMNMSVDEYKDFYLNIVEFIKLVFNVKNFYLTYKYSLLSEDKKYMLLPKDIVKLLKRSFKVTLTRQDDKTLIKTDFFSYRFSTTKDEHEFLETSLINDISFFTDQFSYDGTVLTIGDFRVYITDYNRHCLNQSN